MENNLTETQATTLRNLRIRIFSLTWLSYASYYLTRKNFAVVKSRLENDLGMSMGLLGLIDTVYLVAYAIGQFVNGALGDRFGARRLLGFGMLGSAGLAVICGSTSLAGVFVAAFAANGLFQATGWPNNVKAMAWWFGSRSRGWVMGVWSTCYQFGGLIATALATWLLVQFGWRYAFFGPAIWVAAVGAILLFFLVEKPQDRGLPPTDPEATHRPGTPGGTEQRFFAILKLPTVWFLGSAYAGLKLIRYSILMWLPYYLINALHYDEGTAGYLSVSFEVGGIVGAVVTGWVSDRWFPARRALLAAPMIFGLALALLLYRNVGEIGIWANGLSMALVGFMLFGPDALLSGAAAQDLGGGARSASAAGIINGLGSLGAIFQGYVTTTISSKWGWESLFTFFVWTAMFAAALLFPIAMKSIKSHSP
ncbi:MAG: MFS transporter [Myxococcales bacterium]|nr:MFS transporter [Myxococcales bacterium]